MICNICFKYFRSENPAIKEGEIVCWDCSDYDILGELKTNDFYK